MKKSRLHTLPAFSLALLLAGVLQCTQGGRGIVIEQYTDVQRLPVIRPDYSGIVIPPNITPLNFVIREPGELYLVRIYSKPGEVVEIVSKRPQIIIPPGRWRKLLNDSAGGKLSIDVYLKAADGGWRRYRSIVNTVAREEIDSHIVYRLINPLHGWWRSVGIFQRNLESYHESAVLHGRSFGHGCVNCHTFLNNSPESMVIGARSGKYGSSAILVRGGEVAKLGTKLGYTAWHPSGRLLLYSINRVVAFSHTAGQNVRDVLDLASALCYYQIDSRTVKTVPAISNKQRLETYPAWSPDGRYLYFCSAKSLWPPDSTAQAKFEQIRELRYDLMRISYNIDSDEWGELETVLSAAETGLNVMLPRISPDGRFLLFCLCEYGCFPVYQQSSDLYLMDLETGGYRKLPINSERSESWHSWASNSRWIAFSSKRHEGPLTKLYISYVDKDGKAYKPFVLPQEDPSFYDSFLKAYSVPELITGPVQVGQMELARAVRSSDKIEVDLPITAATPKTEKATGTGTRYQGPE